MKLRPIPEWKKAAKLASVQVFAVLGLFPDIYNGIAALGWLEELPPTAKWCIRGLAAIGIAARLIRQDKLKTDAP
ncbi:hypothetical protein [uncultured Pseudacidovorax sp.]|uniref:DUF7940 domain-containing protein n=1 Tax=uncultured Pseudacidovorax sp. TaxID=679313 RepID=UPI0025CFC3BA|nr:hypothetical protein [uncultured Pseudacidovorax sp.]